jgi:WD40 repeat protein
MNLRAGKNNKGQKTKTFIITMAVLFLPVILFFALNFLFPKNILLNESVGQVSFSPDGKSLALLTSKDQIQIWDVNTKKLIQTIDRKSGDSDYVYIGWKPDGSLIKATWQLDKLKASQELDKNVTTYTLPQSKNTSVFGATISPNGKSFSFFEGPSEPNESLIRETNIIIWDLESLKIIRTISVQYQYPSYGLTFSPDSKFLSYSENGELKLTDVSTGNLYKSFKVPQAPNIKCQVFSPDGNLLAVGADNGIVMIYNLLDNNLQKTFGTANRSMDEQIDDLAFSQNGQILASGHNHLSSSEYVGYDIQLWNVNSGTLIKNLEGDDNFIASLSINSDGTLLASSSFFVGKVRFWELDK